MINNKRYERGFTLTELMIVVTIIAILAAIAYPTYQNYVVKTRRVDAESNLLELSQFMERYFTEVGSYCAETPPNSPCTTAPTLPFNKSPKEGSTTFYNITFTANQPTATAFTLQAAPVGAQTVDTQCGTVSVDSTGVKCVLGGTRCSDSATAADRQAIDDCW